ncbi:unnamed protein product, partial [marine sediment metagenome]
KSPEGKTALSGGVACTRIHDNITKTNNLLPSILMLNRYLLKFFLFIHRKKLMKH